MKEPEHIAIVRALTKDLRPASRKPEGFSMDTAVSLILEQAGFFTDQLHSTGISCPICNQKVKVNPQGKVHPHRYKGEQCSYSYVNCFKQSIRKMRNDRWLRNASKSKLQRKKTGKKKRKPVEPFRKDRLIYAVGHISITSGGLPTLGSRK